MPGFTINTVSLSGNLTRDPEVRSLPSGTSLCQLRLAGNERVKDQSGNWGDRANFFDVAVWGAFGESIAKQLHKGDGVAIQGRLRWREWQAQDGSGRQAVDVVADSAVPIPRNSSSSNSSSGSRREQDVPIDAGGFDRMPPAGALRGADDDIPF